MSGWLVVGLWVGLQGLNGWSGWVGLAPHDVACGTFMPLRSNLVVTSCVKALKKKKKKKTMAEKKIKTPAARGLSA
jgi:hypothetical protein